MNDGTQAIIEPSAIQRRAASLLYEEMEACDSRDECVDLLARWTAETGSVAYGAGHNNPPPELVPEKLIDPDAIPPLLDANYGALVKRGAELEAGIGRWKAGHLVPRPADWPEGKAWPERYAIPSDADNNKTADMLRLLASYAGGKSAASGEVNEAREKVKKPLLDAGKSVDAWFNNLRDGIRADVAILDGTQTAYLREKARLEQVKRDQEVAAAKLEAHRLAEAARISGGSDAAVERAIQAEEQVDRAERAADAPITDLSRTKSAAGTTTSLVDKWTWKLTDIMELAQAVVAGKAPSLFLMANDAVIGAAVRPKNGLRECPGLLIENEAQARRTGRTS